MKKKVLSSITLVTLSTLLIAGYASPAFAGHAANPNSATANLGKHQNNGQTRGDKATKILSGTDWQGTRVYDAAGNDLTAENANFIGLAKYDGETGFYEFFDKNTGETRGDEGTFFVTGDGTKRILISRTQNYQAVVDLTEVSKDKFTYKRLGKDKLGNDVEVYVEHIPYHGKKLAFTNGREALTNQTGKIVTNKSGDKILGTTLWNGTKVVDKNGNDVTAANQNYISLAKFDFQVVDNNKIRAHVSIGTNRYGAALELTELNNDRFTYTRMGKDNAGNDIQVFVEHEPYQGTYHPAFTF